MNVNKLAAYINVQQWKSRFLYVRIFQLEYNNNTIPPQIFQYELAVYRVRFCFVGYLSILI